MSRCKPAFAQFDYRCETHCRNGAGLEQSPHHRYRKDARANRDLRSRLGADPSLKRMNKRLRRANVFGQTSNGHTISIHAELCESTRNRCFQQEGITCSPLPRATKSYRAAAVTTFPDRPTAMSAEVMTYYSTAARHPSGDDRRLDSDAHPELTNADLVLVARVINASQRGKDGSGRPRPSSRQSREPSSNIRVEGPPGRRGRRRHPTGCTRSWRSAPTPWSEDIGWNNCAAEQGTARTRRSASASAGTCSACHCETYSTPGTRRPATYGDAV